MYLTIIYLQREQQNLLLYKYDQKKDLACHVEFSFLRVYNMKILYRGSYMCVYMKKRSKTIITQADTHTHTYIQEMLRTYKRKGIILIHSTHTMKCVNKQKDMSHMRSSKCRMNECMREKNFSSKLFISIFFLFLIQISL